MQRKLLIIGASDPSSLGSYVEACAKVGGANYWDRIATAGISGEDLHLDITNTGAFNFSQWSDVVCTAGVNMPSYVGSLGYDYSIENQMGVNAIAPLVALNRWYSDWLISTKGVPPGVDGIGCLTWTMVSSNSAHIARSQSVGYCASKAALSMGVKSFARTIRDDRMFNVWGYEFGELEGTPMTNGVINRLPPGAPSNRIPRGSMDTGRLAFAICTDIHTRPRICHGNMFRYDGGDQ